MQINLIYLRFNLNKAKIAHLFILLIGTPFLAISQKIELSIPHSLEMNKGTITATKRQIH